MFFSVRTLQGLRLIILEIARGCGMEYYLYICVMKRLLIKYRNWRYRRLFRRLVFVYARNERVGGRAVCYAKDAFYEITGLFYSSIRDGE